MSRKIKEYKLFEIYLNFMSIYLNANLSTIY